MKIRHSKKQGSFYFRAWVLFFTAFSVIGLVACLREPKVDSNTLVLGLESSPTNLDPRYAQIIAHMG